MITLHSPPRPPPLGVYIVPTVEALARLENSRCLGCVGPFLAPRGNLKDNKDGRTDGQIDREAGRELQEVGERGGGDRTPSAMLALDESIVS